MHTIREGVLETMDVQEANTIQSHIGSSHHGDATSMPLVRCVLEDGSALMSESFIRLQLDDAGPMMVLFLNEPVEDLPYNKLAEFRPNYDRLQEVADGAKLGEPTNSRLRTAFNSSEVLIMHLGHTNDATTTLSSFVSFANSSLPVAPANITARLNSALIDIDQRSVSSKHTPSLTRSSQGSAGSSSSAVTNVQADTTLDQQCVLPSLVHLANQLLRSYGHNTSSSGSGNGSQLSTNSRTSVPGGTSGSKRMTETGSDGSEEKKVKRQRPRRSTPELEDRLFACPYFKGDEIRYRNRCAQHQGDDIAPIL